MQELDEFIKICEETIPEYHRFIQSVAAGIQQLQIRLGEAEQRSEQETEQRIEQRAAQIAEQIAEQKSEEKAEEKAEQKTKEMLEQAVAQAVAQALKSAKAESEKVVEKMASEARIQAEKFAEYVAKNAEKEAAMELILKSAQEAAAAAIQNSNVDAIQDTTEELAQKIDPKGTLEPVSRSARGPVERSRKSSSVPFRALPTDKIHRILVVDDVEMNRVLMGHYLKALPLQVDFANSGEDAVERCRENQFDLIIMDLQMKGISGIEASLKIRDFEKMTPIIALTHESPNESERSAVLSAGCNDYLSKNGDRDLLLDCVSITLRL